MDRKHSRRAVLLALGGTLLAVSACSSLEGSPGGVVVPSRNSTVLEGEIRSVDARRGRLQIRDTWSGSRTVRYDNRTRVVYRQRQYPASALERGDIARVTVSFDRTGNAWADRVEVLRSVRERHDVGFRTTRIDGTVSRIDNRRGIFTVRQGRAGQTVIVRMPHRVNRNDARRFDRLRRGDRVRLDARVLGRNEAELVRFR